MKAVILDIDNTVADASHRDHFISGRKKDWDSYLAACKDDTPNGPLIRAVQAMAGSGFKIFIVTGRSEVTMTETVNWLNHYSVPYHHLTMRGGDDRTLNQDYKKRELEIIKRSADANDKPLTFVTAIDSFEKAAAMYENEGIDTMLIKRGIK